MIASLIANAFRGEKQQAFKLEDFLPSSSSVGTFSQSKTPDNDFSKMTAEEQGSSLKRLAIALGAKMVKRSEIKENGEHA